MVIQHNLAAINAQRQTNVNNRFASKNLEKLSSGYRIGRAADDAAGLAISEKMRGQIRGLGMAERNVMDGISLANTIDGAMQTDHDILQRIRELLVQGANGTYSDFDRQMLQKEIDQLVNEIDDQSFRAQFNTIKVLRGNSTEFPSWAAITTRPDGKLGDGIFPGYNAAAIVDFSALDANNVEDLIGKGLNHTCCTCSQRYSIRFNDEGKNGITDNSAEVGVFSRILDVDITGVTTGEELVQRIHAVSLSTNFFNHLTTIDNDPANPAKLIVRDTRPTQSAPSDGSDWGVFENHVFGAGAIDPTKYLKIQAGANRGETISIPITTIDTYTLGMRDRTGNSNISVNPREKADESIVYLDNAINFISGKRAEVGAVQNRLEHTVNNLGATKENLQCAESSIRDADMAKEMMSFTKNNILSQASQSMLAHANQLPQNVMQILNAA